MRYGKNQQALLDFLYLHPGEYHRIKRKRAISAANSLSKKLFGIVRTIRVRKSGWVYVALNLPEMLREQND